MVAHAQADALIERLNADGVQARAYYRVPLHRQAAMAPFAAAALPATDELARTVLAVPMGPAFGPGQARQVTAAVAEALA